MNTVMQEKKNKVILITGASRGIGAFTASLLAQQGHSIVINYANNDQEAKKKLNTTKQVEGFLHLSANYAA